MEQYLEYLRSLDGEDKQQQFDFKLNNYIKYDDWNFSFDAGSVFFDELLTLEVIPTVLFSSINQITSKYLNTAPQDILSVREIRQAAKMFAIWSRQFTEKVDFCFYGLTFDSFLPQNKKQKNAKEVALSKMSDASLVQSRLYKIFKQQLELQQIRNNKVDNYMSDAVYNIMQEDHKKSMEYLSNNYIEIMADSYIEEVTLLELQNKIKTNKMHEISMVKNHINRLIKQEGYVARFITVTNNASELPRGFNKNDKTHWDKVTTPADNSRQLQRRWRNIQSCAKRRGIPLIGIWCKEPHKKGGVHQHILILTKKEFVYNPEAVSLMTFYQGQNQLGKYMQMKNEILEGEPTLEKLFLRTFGYTNRSCKIDVLSKNTGTGRVNNVVNYITKYIMKTINLNKYGETVLDNSESDLNKVSYHRSLWGYRAYGFFGFKNSLTHWRLMRKIVNQNTNYRIKSDKDAWILKAAEAVENNDYSSFIVYAENFTNEYEMKLNKHGEEQFVKVGFSDNVSKYYTKIIEEMDVSDGIHLELETYEIKKY